MNNFLIPFIFFVCASTYSKGYAATITNRPISSDIIPEDVVTPTRGKFPLTVIYIEANDTAFHEVGCYMLQPHKRGPLVDIAIIFAANINYDKVNNRAILFYNQQVLHILENSNLYIRPLQEKGIKVLLSILGNHQGVGICNFQSVEAARNFANQLADSVNKYALDGIDFDDEYANYGEDDVNSDDVIGSPANDFSFLYLVRELRALLPTKIISLYYYGPVVKRLRYQNLVAGDYLNYSWNGEYGKFIVPEVPNLTTAKLGPGAVDLGVTPTELAVALAKKTVEERYGVFLLYQLPITNVSQNLTAISEALYATKTIVDLQCMDNL